jgi:CubicO group peptidase (beta-lactamase class C family)
MTTHGWVATGYEAVEEEFERNFTDRGEIGCSFAAVRDGKPVADLWGGIADPHTGRPWREDTLQLIFSGTKGLVALCMLMLVERGQLNLDAPVARYWPEFAAEGKQDILVRHVVSHQSGLPAIRHHVRFDDIPDPQLLAGFLAEQRPFWPPGEQLCYHGLTYGWLCAELLRRIDGRTLGAFFDQEVRSPLDLDIWIGLPAELEPRVSVIVRRSEPRADESITDREISGLIRENPPILVGEPVVWNSRLYHGAEIGGAGGIGTARSIARLYGTLARGGESDGVRLLLPETLELGRRCLARGTDAIFGWPLAYGVGFALQTELREMGPPDSAFGHCGAGGSAHGAWPEWRVGFSYAMNEMRESMERSDALLAALYGVVDRGARTSSSNS